MRSSWLRMFAANCRASSAGTISSLAPWIVRTLHISTSRECFSFPFFHQTEDICKYSPVSPCVCKRGVSPAVLAYGTAGEKCISAQPVFQTRSPHPVLRLPCTGHQNNSDERSSLQSFHYIAMCPGLERVSRNTNTVV